MGELSKEDDIKADGSKTYDTAAIQSHCFL
jgi:hypothetical protein